MAVKLTEVVEQVKVGDDGLTETTGGTVFEVTLAEEVAVQPLGPVTVTTYVPADEMVRFCEKLLPPQSKEAPKVIELAVKVTVV